MMCSRCNGNICGGRDAITVNHNGCSSCPCGSNAVESAASNDSQNNCNCPNVLRCAACGLTRTICRIVRGADGLFCGNCGCRR